VQQCFTVTFGDTWNKPAPPYHRSSLMEASKKKGNCCTSNNEWIDHPHNTTSTSTKQSEDKGYEQEGHFGETTLISMFEEVRREIFGDKGLPITTNMDITSFLEQGQVYLQLQQQILNLQVQRLELVGVEWRKQQQQQSHSIPTTTHLSETVLKHGISSKFTHLEPQQKLTLTHLDVEHGINTQQEIEQDNVGREEYQQWVKEKAIQQLKCELGRAEQEHKRLKVMVNGYRTDSGVPVCYFCKKVGHKQVHCRFRIRKSKFKIYKQQQNQQLNNHNKQPQQPQQKQQLLVNTLDEHQQEVLQTRLYLQELFGPF